MLTHKQHVETCLATVEHFTQTIQAKSQIASNMRTYKDLWTRATSASTITARCFLRKLMLVLQEFISDRLLRLMACGI